MTSQSDSEPNPPMPLPPSLGPLRERAGMAEQDAEPLMTGAEINSALFYGLCVSDCTVTPTREQELLREARNVLDKLYVDWDGEPEDICDAYTLRNRIDALLNEGQRA